MLELKGITKKFGDLTAVDNVSFTVGDGEFFGLLGPNGAGKTTTIDMISTVLLPSAGKVFFNGQELKRHSNAGRGEISVVTQEYSMRQDMNVEEVLEYQGRLYMLPLKTIKERTEKLLSFAGLIEQRWKTVRHLSGGMKRRLMIIRALLTEPKLLLLDEPTAGMDAISRRQTWGLLKELNRSGLSVILTTHYLEEAESLCGRVALINKGRIAALDSPASLIKELGEYAVEITQGDKIKTRYFKDREEAIGYLSAVGGAPGAEPGSDKGLDSDANAPGSGSSSDGASGSTSFRNTGLEDVFVETVGNKWV